MNLNQPVISATLDTQQGGPTNAAFDLWMLAIRDDKAALEQLTKLAGKGDVQSQFQLSQMYLAGEGVPADPVQSANWLRKAAEQGPCGCPAIFGRAI